MRKSVRREVRESDYQDCLVLTCWEYEHKTEHFLSEARIEKIAEALQYDVETFKSLYIRKIFNGQKFIRDSSDEDVVRD